MKRLKLKKKFKLGIVLFILVIIGIIIGINKYKEYKYHQTYEYKFITLGYTKEEANFLEEKLDSNTLDYYLTIEKNDYVIPLLKQKYFIYKNLERYQEYIKKNKTNDLEKVITMVNVNRDYDYYEHDIETDVSKNELILVNKYYILDSEFEPENLVKISNKYAWGNDNEVNKDVYDAFKSMWNAAYENGYYLMINSAYRSYADQKKVYDNYVTKKGQKYADSIAARPGHSEHSTGLCLDIFSKSNPTKKAFTESLEYIWLQENAYKYGFIIRYPQGKENITGYDYESWHYRYVGLEAAKYIHDNDITFDEYYAYFIEK